MFCCQGKLLTSEDGVTGRSGVEEGFKGRGGHSRDSGLGWVGTSSSGNDGKSEHFWLIFLTSTCSIITQCSCLSVSSDFPYLLNRAKSWSSAAHFS